MSNLNSRYKRSDSGWVQRAVLAGRSVEGKSLRLKKTVTFKGKGLGRIFNCRVSYTDTADPAIDIRKNARPGPNWTYLVENCIFTREGQRDSIGLLYGQDGSHKVGVK